MRVNRLVPSIQSVRTNQASVSVRYGFTRIPSEKTFIALMALSALLAVSFWRTDFTMRKDSNMLAFATISIFGLLAKRRPRLLSESAIWTQRSSIAASDRSAAVVRWFDWLPL